MILIEKEKNAIMKSPSRKNEQADFIAR